MKRIVTLILVAIVLATATGVASYAYLQNAEAHVMAGLESTVVLESKQPVHAGTSFAEAMVQGLIGPVDVPARYASGSMIRPATTVAAGLVAGRDLPAGRLLFQGDFVETMETNAILPIPEGQVAVSFTLAGPNRLAPFLAPGDEVAVIDNLATKAGPMTFDDLLVLGVGNRTPIGTGTAEGSEGLITVAVPLDLAPALVRAINGGGIYLAMRRLKGGQPA